MFRVMIVCFFIITTALYAANRSITLNNGQTVVITNAKQQKKGLIRGVLARPFSYRVKNARADLQVNKAVYCHLDDRFIERAFLKSEFRYPYKDTYLVFRRGGLARFSSYNDGTFFYGAKLKERQTITVGKYRLTIGPRGGDARQTRIFRFIEDAAFVRGRIFFVTLARPHSLKVGKQRYGFAANSRLYFNRVFPEKVSAGTLAGRIVWKTIHGHRLPLQGDQGRKRYGHAGTISFSPQGFPDSVTLAKNTVINVNKQKIPVKGARQLLFNRHNGDLRMAVAGRSCTLTVDGQKTKISAGKKLYFRKGNIIRVR
jgi:hypothetical protein